MSNQLLMRRRANMATPKTGYLKFTAIENNSSVGFAYYSRMLSITDLGVSIEYSTDGNTWRPYTIGMGLENVVPVTLNKGESVIWRGYNATLSGNYDPLWNDAVVTKCVVTGRIAARGDITSLINGVGGDCVLEDRCFLNTFLNCDKLITAPNLPSTTLADSCYSYMFSGCTSLTTAPELPATTLAIGCYGYMFQGCTSLTTAPELPATTLDGNCYGYMFQGCTSLTTAPELPATTLDGNCYSGMFSGCTGLTTAPELPATTLAGGCYGDMFSGCTGLTTAPELPATTLAVGCYAFMFSGCTGLTTAPELPATTLADGCYSYMFSDCTRITTHEVATLNNSVYVFRSNSACGSFTIHSDTPPTISNSTITGLKTNCIIYVPAGSVDAYKAKQYWSARAAYIQAIPG